MYFNQSDLIDMFQGDEEIFTEIRNDFVESYKEMLGEVKAAVDNSDASALQISAHTLKGVLATFCATTSKDIAFDLETMGRDGRVEGALTKYEELEKEVELLIKDLQSMDLKVLAA